MKNKQFYAAVALLLVLAFVCFGCGKIEYHTTETDPSASAPSESTPAVPSTEAPSSTMEPVQPSTVGPSTESTTAAPPVTVPTTVMPSTEPGTVPPATTLPPATEPTGSIPAGNPTVYFSAANSEYKAGERFDVDVHVANVENLAAYQFVITFDPARLKLIETVDGYAQGLIIETDETENMVKTFGINARTVDVADAVVLTLTFEALKSSMGKTEIKAEVTEFIVGLDDVGDETREISGTTDLSASLALKIKK